MKLFMPRAMMLQQQIQPILVTISVDWRIPRQGPPGPLLGGGGGRVSIILYH